MPVVELSREFTFEAAHRLPSVPEGHKCARLHGHSYRVVVGLRGEIGADGMLVDFGVVKAITAPVVAGLDHQVLNDVLDNPTCELLAVWIWEQIAQGLPDLAAVTVCETAATSCTYRGGAA